MAKLEMLLKCSDDAHWEFYLAVEGLSDADLWRRAHPQLLSVGELAGHVAYWEAVSIASYLPEDSPNRIVSPLVDKRFDYYTNEVNNPVALDLGVDEVLNELKKIHLSFRSATETIDPDSDDAIPDRPGFTWGAYLRYQAFHIAYHTGQAFSVRHLMGHMTNDN